MSDNKATIIIIGTWDPEDHAEEMGLPPEVCRDITYITKYFLSAFDDCPGVDNLMLGRFYPDSQVDLVEWINNKREEIT